MATLTASEELVVLTPGVSVTREALALLWSLEDRGLTIEIDDEDLLVGPSEELSASDRDAVRAHKGEIMSLVRMCAVVT